MEPIQSQLSRNRKIFSEFFSAVPKSKLHIEYFEKKDEHLRWFASEILYCKKRGYLNA